MEIDASIQIVLREAAPQALQVLVRRYRDFSACEDAVQEALLIAAHHWSVEGVPEKPIAWLVTAAIRKLTDEVRSEVARRKREQLVVSVIPPEEQLAFVADAGANERDDTLELFFLACHPSLTPASQIALTLRALGGLTTAEIAHAFHVPEATMGQRLSRAKQTLRAETDPFDRPSRTELDKRLPSVLRVLYLIYNEGYGPSSGPDVLRITLQEEAIRITRMLVVASERDPEAMGMLALMLLTEVRRDARVGKHGELIPLDAQDRSRWNQQALLEGSRYLEEALVQKKPGPYQIQAAIAALHDEAPTFEATDWKQIVELYDLLLIHEDSPMARLSRTIAFAMVEGPEAGLRALDDLAQDSRLAKHHRLAAARGHLHERAGDIEKAIAYYEQAANATASIAERNYLLLRAAQWRATEINPTALHRRDLR